MRAVVIKGPFDVKVEDRPLPELVKDTDVILKTHVAGLCGTSDPYRGRC